jgi:hypothetical protein
MQVNTNDGRIPKIIRNCNAKGRRAGSGGGVFL